MESTAQEKRHFMQGSVCGHRFWKVDNQDGGRQLSFSLVALIPSHTYHACAAQLFLFPAPLPRSGPPIGGGGALCILGRVAFGLTPGFPALPK